MHLWESPESAMWYFMPGLFTKVLDKSEKCGGDEIMTGQSSKIDLGTILYYRYPSGKISTPRCPMRRLLVACNREEQRDMMNEDALNTIIG